MTSLMNSVVVALSYCDDILRVALFPLAVLAPAAFLVPRRNERTVWISKSHDHTVENIREIDGKPS